MTGYRVITTVAELDDVPVGAVLIDDRGQGDAWQKRSRIAGRPFARVGSDVYLDAAALLAFAPLLLVYVPEASE